MRRSLVATRIDDADPMVRLETPERASAWRVTLFLVFVVAVFASARGGAALVLETRGLASTASVEGAGTADTDEATARASSTAETSANLALGLADRR